MKDALARALFDVSHEVRTDSTTNRSANRPGVLAVNDSTRRPLGPEALASRYDGVRASLLLGDSDIQRGNLILLAAVCVEMAARLDLAAAA